jgi:hypothetical protein
VSRCGPMYLYTYFGPESGERITIGRVDYEGPEDPRVRAVLLTSAYTTDLEQAERWRLALAAGRHPNLVDDPPIVDQEQVTARISEIPLDSLR